MRKPHERAPSDKAQYSNNRYDLIVLTVGLFRLLRIARRVLVPPERLSRCRQFSYRLRVLQTGQGSGTVIYHLTLSLRVLRRGTADKEQWQHQQQ